MNKKLFTVVLIILFVKMYFTYAATELPTLNIDRNSISISGISAGGAMSIQMHIAYSETFKGGAGVIAGGPFYCAENDIDKARDRCMLGKHQIPLERLELITKRWEKSGEIDPLINLKQEKVYLFSAQDDSIVKQSVVDSAYQYYAYFMPKSNIYYKHDIKAEHSMVTDYYGNKCKDLKPPFINNCNFDLAGNILSFLYTGLSPKNEGNLQGDFIKFDQTEFLLGHGMGATGILYIPKRCKNFEHKCKLHVVLHGCKQDINSVGDDFYKNTGYNKWADTNDIVILYPQAGSSSIRGCFDWWGYDDPNYAKKSARQMQAIKKMVDKIVGTYSD